MQEVVEMDVFIIELENRPGMLAGLAEAIAEKGINVTNIAGATTTDTGTVALLTNDAAGTRSVLDASSVTYRTCGLVSASLEDRPGSLAAATRRIADAGVNIDALFATGMEGGRVTLAIAVDDVEAARSALGDLAAVSA
jgi:hypothetical protein